MQGGFLLDAMGGGNFFSLSNIIFTDQEAVLSTTSTTSMRPLVQSTNGTLDNRSQVLISECEFEGFKNGTFVFESFESDGIGDDGACSRQLTDGCFHVDVRHGIERPASSVEELGNGR